MFNSNISTQMAPVAPVVVPLPDREIQVSVHGGLLFLCVYRKTVFILVANGEVRLEKLLLLLVSKIIYRVLAQWHACHSNSGYSSDFGHLLQAIVDAYRDDVGNPQDCFKVRVQTFHLVLC